MVQVYKELGNAQFGTHSITYQEVCARPARPLRPLTSRRTIYMFWLRSSTYDIVPLCLLRCVSKYLVFPTEEMLDIDVDIVF